MSCVFATYAEIIRDKELVRNRAGHRLLQLLLQQLLEREEKTRNRLQLDGRCNFAGRNFRDKQTEEKDDISIHLSIHVQ